MLRSTNGINHYGEKSLDYKKDRGYSKIYFYKLSYKAKCLRKRINNNYSERLLQPQL